MTISTTTTAAAKIVVNELTATEKKTATALISKMRTAQKSYIQLGQHILEFKTAKLYRETHKNVEAWCKDVLDMDAKTARRLVQAARVCSNLMADGYTYTSKVKYLPVNEGQARTLVPFLDDDNFDFESPDQCGIDFMLACYSSILEQHKKDNAMLTAEGAKQKRLTAAFMDKYRKDLFPTKTETQRKIDLKDAKKKQADEDTEKAKDENKGVEGQENEAVTTENAAAVVEGLELDLSDMTEQNNQLTAAMRTLQTETREAKKAAKTAAGFVDSDFIRTALAIGMKSILTAAGDAGLDAEKLAAFSSEAQSINTAFNTAGLTIDSLLK